MYLLLQLPGQLLPVLRLLIILWLLEGEEEGLYLEQAAAQGGLF
jgi:hypothetical protein